MKKKVFFWNHPDRQTDRMSWTLRSWWGEACNNPIQQSNPTTFSNTVLHLSVMAFIFDTEQCPVGIMLFRQLWVDSPTRKKSTVLDRSIWNSVTTQLYSIIHSKPIHVGGATPEVLVRQEPPLVSERICKSAFDQAFHLTMGSSQSSEKREQKRQVNQSKNTKQSGRGGRPRGQTQRRGVGVHDN